MLCVVCRVVKASTQEKSEVAASLWLCAMTFCNSAKSGNVLCSNITRREAKIQNSNGKNPVFQSLNFKLIIYVRYSCSVCPSGSITVYLGNRLSHIWLLQGYDTFSCSIWCYELPSETEYWARWTGLVQNCSLCGDAHKLKRWFLAWQVLLQNSSVESFLGKV